MRYIKKPEIVDAIQYKGINKHMIDFSNKTTKTKSYVFIAVDNRKESVWVETEEGIRIGPLKKGDYLVRRPDGEYYPYDKDYFESHFEKILDNH